jgi:NTE family protein
MIDKLRIAFSGSGFLAPIFAGFSFYLLESNVTIVEVAGTSGGSIMSALLASGKTSSEIKQTALGDIPRGVLDWQPSVLFKYGINGGQVLQNWLDSVLGDCTFNDAVMPITIMATDIDNGCSFRFSKDTTPNIRLADACRASASVPFIWTPAIVANKKLVDGGMCCNIPVDQLVIDSVPRVGVEVIDGTPSGSTDKFADYLKQCLSTLLGSNENNLIAWAKQTGATIVPVDANPYGFLDPELPALAKLSLFDRGYNAARNYYSKANQNG